jgi:hypothetical protein
LSRSSATAPSLRRATSSNAPPAAPSRRRRSQDPIHRY